MDDFGLPCFEENPGAYANIDSKAADLFSTKTGFLQIQYSTNINKRLTRMIGLIPPSLTFSYSSMDRLTAEDFEIELPKDPQEQDGIVDEGFDEDTVFDIAPPQVDFSAQMANANKRRRDLRAERIAHIKKNGFYRLTGTWMFIGMSTSEYCQRFSQHWKGRVEYLAGPPGQEDINSFTTYLQYDSKTWTSRSTYAHQSQKIRMDLLKTITKNLALGCEGSWDFKHKRPDLSLGLRYHGRNKSDTCLKLGLYGDVSASYTQKVHPQVRVATRYRLNINRMAADIDVALRVEAGMAFPLPISVHVGSRSGLKCQLDLPLPGGIIQVAASYETTGMGFGIAIMC
eukprot:TRINITY_DN14156_c0_g1_i1.p1 TRINITY_DN14156_c0_g1~~TRINITY_DN14156_c0_g1_i1.p1  ORF type:complete len:342 (-),score=59.34 TRINITY_DN14156_c0_g1_i1:37-1062(-)